MIWIDVEINPSPGCGWTAAADNCNFLKRMIDHIRARGKTPGIYSSLYMWQTIMGGRNNCPLFTNVPLWYAHYDGSASFSDWPSVSFGGWGKPNIK
jgi:GH25 family lysozyme M1 (1,4-beta-N-acetylmuramidase)